MMRVHGSNERLYYLDTESPVGGGGEALVYNVRGDHSIVAKVYRAPEASRTDKLSFMLDNPPNNPTAAIKHEAYAWPTALLRDSGSGTVIGFLMPRVTGMKEVFDFYNPGRRRKTCAHFNYRYLMQTARNIAGVMGELHAKGYVIGDVSQRNIVVSDAALVTLLDTDSFQFRDPTTGVLHVCRVRTDGFIAPEAYDAPRAENERTVEQDLFGLGVLVFHLLMEGVHPYSAKYTGQGDPPVLQKNVSSGSFPYAARIPQFEPMPSAPPFGMLAPALRILFIRCFVTGHREPRLRPTAKEWQRALSVASKALIVCPRNQHHYYGDHLQECPWCARVNLGYQDSFPSAKSPAPPAAPIPAQPAVPDPPPSLWWVWIFLAILVGLLLFAASQR